MKLSHWPETQQVSLGESARAVGVGIGILWDGIAGTTVWLTCPTMGDLVRVANELGVSVDPKSVYPTELQVRRGEGNDWSPAPPVRPVR